jgi:dihydroorotase
MKLIKNAYLVNEGRIIKGHLLIDGDKIGKIIPSGEEFHCPDSIQVIEAEGKYVLPGIIDDQVHFRQPGQMHKGDIGSESKAAAAGGITSFMDMPNTIPQTTTRELLEEKYEMASRESCINYSFYIGATNDNIDELVKADPQKVCGIKVFMGASTGNMLVDNPESLDTIFGKSKMLVACHCEDEKIIQRNLKEYQVKFGDDIPISSHPMIRSTEACYQSSALAVKLAKLHNTRLHLLHLSTAKEMELLSNDKSAYEKRITAEVCIHHLWFNEKDYQDKGTWIKWNPAIKTAEDQKKLMEALLDGRIDIVATDHAPHSVDEKKQPYTKCPSGGPLVQHSLVVMLELFHKGNISLEKVVEKMCHAPAGVFKIDKRGFLRPGYYADVVIVDLNKSWTVSKENILYKCGWSPFEGVPFGSMVTHTFVNGRLVYQNGRIESIGKGMRLLFNR